MMPPHHDPFERTPHCDGSWPRRSVQIQLWLYHMYRGDEGVENWNLPSPVTPLTDEGTLIKRRMYTSTTSTSWGAGSWRCTRLVVCVHPASPKGQALTSSIIFHLLFCSLQTPGFERHESQIRTARISNKSIVVPPGKPLLPLPSANPLHYE